MEAIDDRRAPTPSPSIREGHNLGRLDHGWLGPKARDFSSWQSRLFSRLPKAAILGWAIMLTYGFIELYPIRTLL
jgi:hypothetical protein